MRLSDFLDTSGESQAAFALRVGVTQARISQLVSGGTPSVPLAQRISAATKGKVALSDWPAPTGKAA